MKTFKELREETCDLVTKQDIRELEKFADALLNKFGVEIDFTKHFGDRFMDDRNKPCIKISELVAFFKKINLNKGKKLKKHKDQQVLLKDIQSKLNMPVVIEVDKSGKIDVVFKTIMRKKGFKTSNPILKYEGKDVI